MSNQINSKKTIFGIAVILTVVIILSVYLRLPSNWKEKVLFPKSFPNVLSTAVTNNRDNFNFSEKIWLHRVNSIERANIMTEKYKGIEMDITWVSDSAQFYVYHDDDTRPEIYLPLHQMFDSIKNIQNHYIWLDFKNLNEENTTLALDYLLKLKINRANVIVESGEPHLLSDFSAAGFATSYYLPIFNPYTASENEITGYVKEIDTMLQKSNVNFISSDFVKYRFIKKYFPGSQVLLWHLEKNRYTPYVRNILVRDKNVKVILVYEYSEGYQ